MASPTLMEWPKGMTNSSPTIDLDDLAAEFEEDKYRLFIDSEDEEWSVEGLSPAQGNLNITKWDEMQEFLQSSAETEARFMSVKFLNQGYSWGPIKIPPECAKLLFSTIGVMPEFWKVLQAFGRKTTPVDESYGGIFQGDNLAYEEYCYLIKHVEWSIPTSDWRNRQMGVYHQRRMAAHTAAMPAQESFDTFIIINPTATVKKLLLQICDKNSEPKPTPELVHTTIANTLTVRWKKRVGDLETQLDDISVRAKITSIEESSEGTGLSFAFDLEDTQLLCDMRDKILIIDGLLEINGVVFEAIQSKISGSPSYKLRMESIRAEIALQRSRSRTTLQRLDACLSVIRNIMQIRQARIAQDDNRLMAEDAKSSYTLTVLALVFIPASFAAQVLSMGYVKFGGQSVVGFEKGIFGFLVLTAICIVITYVLYEYLQRGRGKQHSDRVDEEKGGQSPGKELLGEKIGRGF
ncbi:hypothetical protein BGX38DRAFT_1274091 [Terfezia claveryi]|nr:hypothetical protein BGX38DRAFT_1274091 [Terfezia claveryi]